MALMWRELYPKHNVTCWTFGCPSNVSKDISDGCSSWLTSVICRHDIIPRLSFGSLYDLKEKMKLVQKKLTSVTQRISWALGAQTYAKKWIEDVGITHPVLRGLKPHEKLHPPGRIIYLYSQNNDKDFFAEESHGHHFDEIPLSSTTLTDHWPGVYETLLFQARNHKAYRNAMSNHVHSFVPTWFSTPTWCGLCNNFISNPMSPNGQMCTKPPCILKVCFTCKPKEGNGKC